MTLDDIKELCADFGYVDNGGHDALRYWLRERLETASSPVEDDDGWGGANTAACDGCEDLNEELTELRAELAKLRGKRGAGKKRPAAAVTGG